MKDEELNRKINEMLSELNDRLPIGVTVQVQPSFEGMCDFIVFNRQTPVEKYTLLCNNGVCSYMTTFIRG